VISELMKKLDWCATYDTSVNTRRCVMKRKQRDLPVVYIAEEGLCDTRELLRQQHIVEVSSALSRAAAGSALSRAYQSQ
jgi:hypothetical protein